MFMWIIIVIHKQYSILAISAVAGWKAPSLLNNINIRTPWKQTAWILRNSLIVKTFTMKSDYNTFGTVQML